MIKFQSNNFRQTDTQEHFIDTTIYTYYDTQNVILISFKTFTQPSLKCKLTVFCWRTGGQATPQIFVKRELGRKESANRVESESNAEYLIILELCPSKSSEANKINLSSLFLDISPKDRGEGIFKPILFQQH